jgi:hypothetical protein
MGEAVYQAKSYFAPLNAHADTTAMDGGSAGYAGAVTCQPHGLGRLRLGHAGG